MAIRPLPEGLGEALGNKTQIQAYLDDIQVKSSSPQLLQKIKRAPRTLGSPLRLKTEKILLDLCY